MLIYLPATVLCNLIHAFRGWTLKAGTKQIRQVKDSVHHDPNTVLRRTKNISLELKGPALKSLLKKNVH